MEDVAPGIDHGNVSDDLPDEFQRQAVFYRSQLPVGTIVVETAERHLYLIESETRALRYGIGVGRDGASAAGLLRVSHKAAWPDWVAPAELIARLPYLPRFVAGGPGNAQEGVACDRFRGEPGVFRIALGFEQHFERERGAARQPMP